MARPALLREDVMLPSIFHSLRAGSYTSTQRRAWEPSKPPTTNSLPGRRRSSHGLNNLPSKERSVLLRGSLAHLHGRQCRPPCGPHSWGLRGSKCCSQGCNVPQSSGSSTTLLLQPHTWNLPTRTPLPGASLETKKKKKFKINKCYSWIFPKGVIQSGTVHTY